MDDAEGGRGWRRGIGLGCLVVSIRRLLDYSFSVYSLGACSKKMLQSFSYYHCAVRACSLRIDRNLVLTAIIPELHVRMAILVQHEERIPVQRASVVLRLLIQLAL